MTIRSSQLTKITSEHSKIVAVKLDKPWGCADYPPSDGGIWKVAGTVARTPNKDSPSSHEKLHRSIEARRNFYKGKSEPWTHPHIRGMDYDDLGTLELAMRERHY